MSSTRARGSATPLPENRSTRDELLRIQLPSACAGRGPIQARLEVSPQRESCAAPLFAMSKGAVAERASQPTHRDELADWTRTGCRDSCACRVSLSAARGEGDVSGDVEAERS